MKRVWILEDAIPVHVLPYTPTSIDQKGLKHLLEKLPQWDEAAVRSLCEELCSGDYDVTAVSSTDELIRHLDSGVSPPHAIIFDWETTGYTDERNVDAIRRVLSRAFSYVQVYTHLGADAVSLKLTDLFKEFPARLLPPREKPKVEAKALQAEVQKAWATSIAGDVADRVRQEVRVAVEGLLTDFCSIPSAALSAISTGGSEQLTSIALARLRDGLSSDPINIDSATALKDTADLESLRKLLSIYYYFFSTGALVRTGDLIRRQATGEYALVVTPWCHLESFSKKTGGWLTLVEAIPLTSAAFIKEGIKLPGGKGMGWSATANHNEAGYSVVPLPNVPTKFKDRTTLIDLALVSHRWTSVKISKVANALKYPLDGFDQVCTLSEAFNTGVVSHLAKLLGSVGVPDFPPFELERLKLQVMEAPKQGPK